MTKPGTAGNARYYDTPLRQWTTNSYSPIDGRSKSSLSADQSGKSPVTSAHGAGGNWKEQVPPSGFYGRDAARTTIAKPVRSRPYSQSR